MSGIREILGNAKRNPSFRPGPQGLQWQRALCLLSEMEEQAMPLDLVALNSAINACKKEGRWQEALQLMPFGADAKTLGAVVSACERGGAWQVALRLLEDPRCDAMALRAGLMACHRGSAWRQALRLLPRLEVPGAAAVVVDSFLERPEAE